MRYRAYISIDADVEISQQFTASSPEAALAAARILAEEKQGSLERLVLHDSIRNPIIWEKEWK